MKTKIFYLLTVGAAVIAIDQLTKIYVHTHFELHESVVVIKNFFNLTYVRNFAAAFGIGGDTNPAFREVFFLLMPPVAIGIILMILKDTKEKDRLHIFSLSLIFGGAIGNYIDRLKFRYVIDFLDFHYFGKASWPAFNIADSAIVVGVGILLFLMAQESFIKKNLEESTAKK